MLLCVKMLDANNMYSKFDDLIIFFDEITSTFVDKFFNVDIALLKFPPPAAASSPLRLA